MNSPSSFEVVNSISSDSLPKMKVLLGSKDELDEKGEDRIISKDQGFELAKKLDAIFFEEILLKDENSCVDILKKITDGIKK